MQRSTKNRRRLLGVSLATVVAVGAVLSILVRAESISVNATSDCYGKCPLTQGYWLVGDRGAVYAYGRAKYRGGVRTKTIISGIVSTPGGGGYWLVGENGGVYTFGNAHYKGSLPAIERSRHFKEKSPVVGIASSSNESYWLASANGGVYTFGATRFFGSIQSKHYKISAPIVAITATSDNRGYWLLTAAGGIYSFGDAHYHGSITGRHQKVHNVVAMASTPDGKGYWIVQSNGRVSQFGDARFYGSLPYLAHFSGTTLPSGPVVGMASTSNGLGYWIVESTGKVYSFGDAQRLKQVRITDGIVGISPVRNKTTSR